MPSRIREICRQFSAEAVTYNSDGTRTLTPTAHLRLLANGVVWHETDFSELLQASAGLTDTVLTSHTIEDDLFSFSAYCTEVLIGPNPYRPETLLNYHLSRLLKMCVQTHTGALEYLVFPLLEGVTKSACPDVDLDGVVLRDFDVGHGRNCKYGPTGKDRRKKISSVHDLLWHLHDDVADDLVRAPIHDIEQHIHQAIGVSDDHNGFATIYRLRNSALHGADFSWMPFPILNLSFLIAIGRLGPGLYEERRNEIASSLVWRANSSMSYYPY